jgi:hypothetical protein
MNTPFTTEHFFNIFEQYNSSIFPAQILILVLGLTALLLIHARHPIRNKTIGVLLGLLWFWMGAVYHIGFFSSINKAAYAFGGLFILQGLLITYETFARGKLEFRFKGRLIDYLGYFFILYGLIIYPAIGLALEPSLPRIIALGLPCPSTILTFGFLMLTEKKLSKYLLIIPSLWAVIGLGAALSFGVYQDFMMILAAILADILLLSRKKTKTSQVA